MWLHCDLHISCSALHTNPQALPSWATFSSLLESSLSFALLEEGMSPLLLLADSPWASRQSRGLTDPNPLCNFHVLADLARTLASTARRCDWRSGRHYTVVQSKVLSS